MLRLAPPKSRRQAEPTIALVNIEFLMLIFFLIAGTLSPPTPPDLSHITSENAPPTAPPDALAIDAVGRLYNRAEPTTLSAFLAARGQGDPQPIRVLADQNLPAPQLLDVLGQLRRAGAGQAVLITERTR